MKLTSRFSWFGLAAVVIGMSGCTMKHEKPNFVYMPDMMYGPDYNAQEPGANRLPVAGTIPRGYQPYAFRGNPEAAERALVNPVRMTREDLYRGKHMYETYCLVCHGPVGEGDGTVVPKFPRPPSLQSDKVKRFPDGRIYHIITEGQNLMPSYASQIREEDRWAIVNYIKVLHRAKSPSQEDLRAYEQEYN